MTPEQIEILVDAISQQSFDSEAAHAAEDALHQTVLASIAAGLTTDPAACAAAALRTRSIAFARWYA